MITTLKNRDTLYIVIATIGYATVAILNLQIARPSPIWIPAGLSVALLMLGGRKYVWAIAGGILISAAATGTFASAVGIVRTPFVIGGNIVEALVVAYPALYEQNRKGQSEPFTTVKGNVRFYIAALIGAGISALVGATVPTLMLGLSFAEWANRMQTWHLGDFIGIIVTVPLILSMHRRGRDKAWIVPAGVITSAVIVYEMTISQENTLLFFWLSFVMFAVLVFTDDVRGAAVGLATQLVVFAISIAGEEPEAVFEIQVYIASISSIVMLAASSRLELKRKNEALLLALQAFEERLRGEE